jgi:hypothetical protein
LKFTEPVDPASLAPGAITAENYTYIYQSSYGSPEVDKGRPVIRATRLSADGLTLALDMDLVEGHIHEMKFPGLRNRSGQPLLHPSAYFTLNAIPSK